MSTRTFTDEGGNKFELDVEKSKRFAGKGTYVIKPIKAVEKKTYKLSFGETQGMKDSLYSWGNWLTEPQAQKVAEAIEALMEIVTGERVSADYLDELAVEARKAFLEDV